MTRLARLGGQPSRAIVFSARHPGDALSDPRPLDDRIARPEHPMASCRTFPASRDLLRDEDGAVTVDWVALSVAAVGLAVVAGASFGTAVTDGSATISTLIGTANAPTSP